MYDAPVAPIADFSAWRQVARAALAADLPPERLAWRSGDAPRELQACATLEAGGDVDLRVPAVFVELARSVICHRSAERFGLLYQLLWRIGHGERSLLQLAVDRDVRRAHVMAGAVRRDLHKMKAFVRFRRVANSAPEHFVAWFEPDHHIVDAAAPFFQRRFTAMRWSILTPERSAHWDGAQLSFGSGTSRRSAPDGDALEELWQTYYAHIFNPARLKVQAMRTEMPKKYWKNLPEAGSIRALVEAAGTRVTAMVAAGPTAAPAKATRWAPRGPGDQPVDGGLPALQRELMACERCALHRFATAAVAGEGPADARLMVVGEQPGDEEDLRGRPFVGPAGRLLDELMAASGIARERTYLTNAVKHFRFQPRGKRRMHQRPDGGHVEHCRWWLERELALVRPDVIVALGATAAQALLRRSVALADLRGRPLPCGPATLVVTWHPAYLLRLRDPAQQSEARAGLLADLRTACGLLAKETAARGRAPGAGSAGSARS